MKQTRIIETRYEPLAKKTKLDNDDHVRITLDFSISSNLLIRKIRDVKEEVIFSALFNLIEDLIINPAEETSRYLYEIDIIRDEKYIVETMAKFYRLFEWERDTSQFRKAIDKAHKLLKLWHFKQFTKYSIMFNNAPKDIICKIWAEDREIALALVKVDGSALKEFHINMRLDKEIVLAAVQESSRILEIIPESLKKDRDVIRAALPQYWSCINFIPKELHQDREFIIELSGYFNIHFPSPISRLLTTELRNDTEFMRQVFFKSRGFVFFPELLSNRDLILEALKRNDCIQTLSHLKSYLSHYLNDREIVMGCVKKNGASFEYISEELRGDREIVMIALERNGFMLKYAAEELKKDREVVLVAVKQDGYALEFASDELKQDRDVVLTAIQREGTSLQFASNNLRDDRELVLIAVKQNGLFIKHTSTELKHDRDILIASVEQNSLALPPEFSDDKEIVLIAIRENGHSICKASERLKNDRQVVLAAIQQDTFSIIYASEDLRNDKEIWLEILKLNPITIQVMPQALLLDRELLFTALQYCSLDTN